MISQCPSFLHCLLWGRVTTQTGKGWTRLGHTKKTPQCHLHWGGKSLTNELVIVNRVAGIFSMLPPPLHSINLVIFITPHNPYFTHLGWWNRRRRPWRSDVSSLDASTAAGQTNIQQDSYTYEHKQSQAPQHDSIGHFFLLKNLEDLGIQEAVRI